MGALFGSFLNSALYTLSMIRAVHFEKLRFPYPKAFVFLFIKSSVIGHFLTLFDMGGGVGHDDPQYVFDHCALTLRRRKLKLADF